MNRELHLVLFHGGEELGLVVARAGGPLADLDLRAKPLAELRGKGLLGDEFTGGRSVIPLGLAV